MNYKKEEFDDFLENVNDVHDQIKKITSNDYDITKLSKEEEKFLEKQERKKKLEEIKKKEEEDKINKGRKGKGHIENYVSFCKKCFIEYIIQKDNCYHCNSKTISCKERREFLLEKAKELKKKQAEKKEKQRKWELWQKTKKIYWKKNSINYEKWEYFTDSEEENEEEKDPVLPENDPSFVAMKKDIDERAVRVKQQKKKANEFKIKGNEKFKKGDYFKAIEFYSNGIDEYKQMKEWYTNRALAYLKYEKYDKCIEDCEKILEYCEVLEDGYEKSSFVCTKAFYRKIKAKLEGNLINDKIIEDFKNYKLLVGEEDKNYIELSNIYKRKKEEKNIYDSISNFNDEFKLINEFLKEKGKNNEFYKNYDFLILNDYLKKDDKNLIYFINKNGVFYINKIFKNNIFGKDWSMIILIRELSEKSETFIDDMMDYNLINNILKKINNIKNVDNEVFKEDKSNFNFDMIILLEELFEILVSLTLNEKCRNYLKNKYIILNEIFNFFINSILDSYKFYFPIYESCINFFSNLIFNEKGNNEIKNYIIDNFSNKIIIVFTIIIKDCKMINLKKMVYNFLCNLFTDIKFKENFYNFKNNNEKFISVYNDDMIKIWNKIMKNKINSDTKFNSLCSYLENIWSIYINSTISISDYSIYTKNIKNKNLILNIYKFLHFIIINKNDIKNFDNLFIRILFFTNKNFDFCLIYKNLKVENEKIFKFIIDIFINDTNSKLFSEAIKFFAYSLNNDNKDKDIKTLIINELFIKNGKQIFENLNSKLEKYLDNEIIYCNLCKVLCNFIDIEIKTANYLGNLIENLIKAVANKIGRIRTNSAILLARICKNEKNLEKTRELKGTEILINLKDYLI